MHDALSSMAKHSRNSPRGTLFFRPAPFLRPANGLAGRFSLRRWFGLLAIGTLLWTVLFWTLPLPAHANEPTEADREQARQHAHQGQELLLQKKYLGALEHFSKAYSLIDAPTLLLGIARAEVGLGRLASAYRNYRKIIERGAEPSDPEPFQRAVRDAEAEIRDVEPGLAWIRIVVEADGNAEQARVALDGEALSRSEWGENARAIDPGSHTIKVTLPGYRTVEKQLLAARGERLDPVVVELPSLTQAPVAPAAETSAALTPEDQKSTGGISRKTWGYIALGTAGAALATGGVFGVMTLKKKSQLDDRCVETSGGRSCPPGQQATLDDYQKFGNIATIGFIAGGVFAGAGTFLLLTAPKEESGGQARLRVSPYVGVGSLGAVGSF